MPDSQALARTNFGVRSTPSRSAAGRRSSP